MYTVSRTFTLGSNRGKPRLWLEGAWLAKLGFDAKQTQYRVYILPGRNRIEIEAGVGGTYPRRVSGKGDRPIIDITGDQLAPFAGRTLTLTGTRGRIIITAEEV
jgi:hypothetical protein